MFANFSTKAGKSPATPKTPTEATSLLPPHRDTAKQGSKSAGAAPSGSQTPTRSSHLLPFHRDVATQTAEPAGIVTKPKFTDRISGYFHKTQPTKAQAHAEHFWCLKKMTQRTHPYKPGLADALRCQNIEFSAKAVTALVMLSGFMDSAFPHGTTWTNPTGKRNELAAMTWLLGALIGLEYVAPHVAGAVYGSLIRACGSVSEKLHDHPLSTRIVGAVGVAVGAAGGAAGAVLVKERNKHSHVGIPENGWTTSFSDNAEVLELLAAIPAFMAIGWYVGRISSAAVRRSRD